MKKMTCQKILLAMSLSAVMSAHAELVQPENIMTANATLAITEPLQPLTFEVTARQGVSAPKAGVVLATGRISTPSQLSSDQFYALRWAPGNGLISPSNATQVIYSGKTNSSNQIAVQFRFTDATEDASGAAQNGWVKALKASGPDNEVNFEVINMAENVKADTYSMYMDAGIYTL